MEKRYIIFAAFLILVLSTIKQTYGQIGGNNTPLINSVHTYSVLMDNTEYNAQWGVYPAGTPQSEIEDNSAVPLVQGVDFSFISQTLLENQSLWRIQFDKKIDEGQTYVIGYRETTVDDDLCVSARVLSVTIYPSFDVDIELADKTNDFVRCGDGSEQLQGSEEAIDGLQTTIKYTVFINYPDEAAGGYYENGTWSFNFNIVAEGRGGASAEDATIAQVTASGIGMADLSWIPGTSSFTSNVSVNPSSVTPVTLTVVYNDVLGVTQDLTVRITDIYGSFSERDVDELENNEEGNNIVRNTIYAMPDVGPIMAWN